MRLTKVASVINAVGHHSRGKDMRRIGEASQRAIIASIAEVIAECRESARWPSDRENGIEWFHIHRAKLRTKISAAPRLP